MITTLEDFNTHDMAMKLGEEVWTIGSIGIISKKIPLANNWSGLLILSRQIFQRSLEGITPRKQKISATMQEVLCSKQKHG